MADLNRHVLDLIEEESPSRLSITKPSPVSLLDILDASVRRWRMGLLRLRRRRSARQVGCWCACEVLDEALVPHLWHLECATASLLRESGEADYMPQTDRRSD